VADPPRPDPRSRPQSFCPTIGNITRNAGSRPERGHRPDDARRRQEAPFGTDLVFAATDLADFVFHAEICEDFLGAGAAHPRKGALAGALILCNLSASNIVVGKA
jgi:hypothetical protein